jgi:hypothetical protein
MRAAWTSRCPFLGQFMEGWAQALNHGAGRQAGGQLKGHRVVNCVADFLSIIGGHKLDAFWTMNGSIEIRANRFIKICFERYKTAVH